MKKLEHKAQKAKSILTADEFGTMIVKEMVNSNNPWLKALYEFLQNKNQPFFKI